MSKKVTSSGRPPEPGTEGTGAPGHLKENGQHSDYWVLSEEERAKGFVRPVRNKYIHTGIRPKHPLRDLTDEEKENFKDIGYVKFEEYPKTEGKGLGRFWTEKELNSGCGAETTMSQSIAETYARDPKFYGSTFCVHCKDHFLVKGFTWSNSDELVGS